MKAAPLPLRLLLGALIIMLLAVGLLQPLLTKGECAALIALGAQGKPYVFGAEGPESYDCSGLTRSAYACLDVDLIHSAQYVAYDDRYQTVSDPSELIVGDLIFFDTVADKDKCDHVGVWIGMNRFVHASSSQMVVMVSDFDEKWRSCYSWSKRVLSEEDAPAPALLIRRLKDAFESDET